MGYTIITHDLDFGTLLALSRAAGPSIVLVRGEDVIASAENDVLVRCLNRFRNELERGALISLTPQNERVRILPLG
ncbi:MAG: DUF5615 family PIN-like protein [Candidatus Sumerlaeaceae bacterium]